MTRTQRTEANRKDKSRHHVMVICHEFSTETSAHGMSHIIRARGKRRRTFWIFITLGLVALWLLHSQDTLRKFLKNEVNVQVTIKTNRQLPFPAVTVCNKNPYKEDEVSALLDEMNYSASVAAANNSPTTDYAPSWFLPWIAALQGDNTEHIEKLSSAKFGEQLLQLLSEIVELYGEQYGYYFPNLTVTYDEFVVNCMYEREECSKRKDIIVETVFNWLHGNCITYRINHNSTRTGPRFGLELVLNIQQDDYMDTQSQAGAIVLVHPQNEMPFPDDEGISIPPGQAALVGVKVKSIQRLGGKFGECVGPNNQPNFTNYFNKEYNWTGYSLKTCERSCFQRNVRDMCKCFDIRFPPYDEYQNVSSCVAQYYSTYNFSLGLPSTFGCQDEVVNKFNSQQLGCDNHCFVPCRETIYEPMVSYAAWPSDVTLNQTFDDLKGFSKGADEIIEAGPEKFRSNMLQLTVYFKDLNYESISESAAVEITQMLSDLGGNTGMYVGASLFTIIEFVEFFGDLWMWICCRKKRRKLPKTSHPVEEEFIQDNNSPPVFNIDTRFSPDNRHHNKLRYPNDDRSSRSSSKHSSDHTKHGRPKDKRAGRDKSGSDNNGFFFNHSGHLQRTPYDHYYSSDGLY